MLYIHSTTHIITMAYKPAIVDFTPKQIDQMVKGKPVRISHSQIGKGKQVILLHPENHLKLSKAHQAGRGCVLHVADGEVMATHHSTMDGTGFFGDLWKGIKSVGSWLKDSGVGSALADVAQTAATPFVGAQAADIGRKILKTTTGVGMAKKKRMSRKTNSLYGGSFLMPHE